MCYEQDMRIAKVLGLLDEMKGKGIIEKYAIGGAMACVAYIEPFVTYDLDVFVLLPSQEGHLISITPIYAYLREKGYRIDKEHVIIDDVPVQFIPAYNKLTEEAVNEAVEMRYKTTKMPVFRIEHLLAIMIQTDRPKDRTRIVHVLDQAKVDDDYLVDILRRHRLLRRWNEFKRKFYGN